MGLYTNYLIKAVRDPRYAFHVAKMRGLSMLSRTLFSGWSAPPETLSFYLTHRCNLRCSMCGQWNPEDGSNQSLCAQELDQSLSVDEITAIFDEVSYFKPNITLFGGEPMVYPDFFAIVRAAKQRNLRVNMVSNMALSYDRAEEIVRSGLDEIIVSIDGVRDVHDQQRGVKGTFNRTVRGIMHVNQIKKSLGVSTPKINISCTITRDSQHTLEEVAKLAEFLDCGRITFHHLIHISQETYNDSEKIFMDEFGVKPSDFAGFVLPEKLWGVDSQALIDSCSKLRKRLGKTAVSFYPDLTDNEIETYYSANQFQPETHPHRCVSPWITVYIFPDGSIRPCLSTNYHAGNLREETFMKIWNGEKFTTFRNDLKKRKNYPFCSKCTEMYRF